MFYFYNFFFFYFFIKTFQKFYPEAIDTRKKVIGDALQYLDEKLEYIQLKTLQMNARVQKEEHGKLRKNFIEVQNLEKKTMNMLENF